MSKMETNDLFSCAQIGEMDLRAFAQNSVRKKINPLTQGYLRKARAKPRSGNARFSARANTPGLFGAGDDDLADLELTLRQINVAVEEKTAELTHQQAAVAPWWEMWRDACSTHASMVKEAGFALRGAQADFRRAMVSSLDRLRADLRPHFLEVARLQGEVRSLRNRARGVETEIRIIKAKQKRRAA